jgi:hypothetical protein
MQSASRGIDLTSMCKAALSGLQRCKGNSLLKVRWGKQKFSVMSRESRCFFLRAAPARIYLPPRKAHRGRFNVRRPIEFS